MEWEGRTLQGLLPVYENGKTGGVAEGANEPGAAVIYNDMRLKVKGKEKDMQWQR